MKLYLCKKLTCLVLLLTVFSGLSAQMAVLQGNIIDKENQDPLISATVQLGDKGTTTDLDGRYKLEVAPGFYTLEVTYIGYQTISQTIELLADHVETLDLALGTTATLLETATITSGKYQKPLSEVTVSLEVLKADLLESTNATSIDDALEKIPGLTIIDGQANIRGGSGWSYGAGSRVLLMIDDMPAMQADAGFPNWNDIPIENTEQTEIIKGAASALYGSAAMNGIINVRTAYAKSKPVTKVSTFYRSFLNPKDEAKVWWKDKGRPFETGLSLAHRQKFNKFDLVLGGYALYSNSYREDTYHRYGRISIGTRYRINDRLSVGINSNINRGKNSSYFYWRNAESAYQGDTTSISVSKNFRFNIDPFLTYFDHSGSKHRILSRFISISNDNNADQSNTSQLFYGEYQFQKQIPEIAMVATAGLVGFGASVSAPLYGDTTFQSSNVAAYLQLEKKFFKKLNLSGGVRFERNEQRSPEIFAGDTIPDGKVVESKPVFRFGLNYQLTKTTFLRASWGQGYRYPTIAEKFINTSAGGVNIAPNIDITSETGWSAEFGIKQGFKIGKWDAVIDGAAFITRYQDMVEFNLRIIPLPPSFLAKNIGDTEIKGLDFTLTGQGKLFGLPTTLLTGYTFIVPKYQDFNQTLDDASSADYNVLKYRSRHSFKFDMESKIGPVSIGVAAFYNSNVEAIDKILNILIPGVSEYREINNKGAATLDLRLGYQFIKSGKFSLIIANLLNAEYMRRPGLLEAPRNITARVDFQF